VLPLDGTSHGWKLIFRDFQDFWRIQTEFMQAQWKAFAEQTKELTESATKSATNDEGVNLSFQNSLMGVTKWIVTRLDSV
jgi:hypothetical protein